MVQNISSKSNFVVSDTEQEYFVERGKFENDLLDVFNRSKTLSLDDEDSSEEISYYSETSSSTLDEEILLQIQVTNNLLGIMLALQIFMICFAIMRFFIRIIENNVTKHFV